MLVEYTGRHTEVPAEVRKLVEKKLPKLARTLGAITHVHVILSAGKHSRAAEVSVHSRNLDLAAAEDSADFATSVSAVFDRLLRQAQRHVGRRRERKRRAPARATALWSGVLAQEPVADDGRPRVIRSQRFVVKPMTVEEAAMEVGRSDEGLLVFRDARTERVNVLFRRRDGNLGLIEPEA